MEIIKSNGLVPINDTASLNTNADGVGNGGNNPAAREVTCVKNDRGQVFCYEVLEPDENCLKPIKEEAVTFMGTSPFDFIISIVSSCCSCCKLFCSCCSAVFLKTRML